MDLTNNISKLTIFLVIFILLSVAIVARQFHPANDVDPGIFQTGLFTFPVGGTLNISSSLILPTTSISGAGHNSGLDADTLDGYHESSLQRIVSGTCGTGSSIRVINSDGSVTCENDDDTTVDGCSNCLDGTEVNEAGLSCTAITGGAGLCDGSDADTTVDGCNNCLDGTEVNEAGLSCTAITGGAGLCDGTDNTGIGSCSTITSSGLSYNGNPVIATCSSGRLTGGGCQQTSSGVGTGFKGVYPSGSSFYCEAAYSGSINAPTVTASAICCS